eukprot:scpid106347/ scgid5816/ 
MPALHTALIKKEHDHKHISMHAYTQTPTPQHVSTTTHQNHHHSPKPPPLTKTTTTHQNHHHHLFYKVCVEFPYQLLPFSWLFIFDVIMTDVWAVWAIDSFYSVLFFTIRIGLL